MKQGSAAAAGGILAQDIIIVVNGRKVDDLQVLKKMLSKNHEKQLTISVMRGYGKINLNVPPRGEK